LANNIYESDNVRKLVLSKNILRRK